MNPVLIAAGIYISSRIVRFIADELSDSEIKKQKEINDEIDKIRNHHSTSLTEEELINNLLSHEEIAKKRKEIEEYLKNQAELRIEEFKELRNDIDNSKQEVVSAIHSKEVVHTPLRKNSLELLLRQLCEAKEKCIGYIKYLEVYIDDLPNNKTSIEPKTFFFQLPQMYPYVGKVIWINANNFSSNCIEYDIPNLFTITIKLIDSNVIEYNENSILPLMITGGKRKCFWGSLEKGAFKGNELINTHLGISATVKEIQKNRIILSYLNQLELSLSRDNLIKPDRFPPIHSNLTVFPIKWEYNLSHFSYKNGKLGYPVEVSERKEDAGSSFAFRNFPICFTTNDFSLFMNFYNERELEHYDEEFLIGPVNSKDTVIKKGTQLKLQFGDIPLFYIEVDEFIDRTDILRYYFRFHHMCDANDTTFSADDIFLPFNVSFTPYYAGTSVEMIKHYMEIDDIDDVAALIWDLFEEFRIQEQIKKDREGMSYFYKWENITNQLITILEQGDSIVLEVRWLTSVKRNMLLAEIINYNQLKSFIIHFSQKNKVLLKQEWKPKFFIKDNFDNRYSASLVDGGKRLRVVGKDVANIFSGNKVVIELFVSNQPYAEYQQKAALRQFRIGRIVNPAIQAACLNSSTIESHPIDGCSELLPFFNEQLYDNLSQRRAVEQAFKEKNIFLIQGPPGTGKTTVIRELVEQVLAIQTNSHVLIISQANVAVDNALKGLIKKYCDQTVRCGNGQKIVPEFQKVWLNKRCQDYLDILAKRKEAYEDSFYKSWQDTIISNEMNTFSPVLFELIIRSHRLIGATCVGLAKRNIGLERTEFDLVIIDEAGKALPAELLIPLVRAKKAVIIGDQNQLPPVINPLLYDAEKIDLEERSVSENCIFCHSLFERLYDNAPDSCKVMLDTQFRMPAVIGSAISTLFYEGKLKNGMNTENRQPVLFSANLTFINFDGNRQYSEKKDSNNQITNYIEAQAAVSLVLSIRQKDKECSIAVITPYKGQKNLIIKRLIKAGIKYRNDEVYIDTIDSFQGSEADIVVFCSTRAIKPTLFFKDTKRINVALSRAKRELIIIGRMSYYYKYSRTESCLPLLADYIKNHGNIIGYNNCEEIRLRGNKSNSKEILLGIEEILLPTAFYLEDCIENDIQMKIEEYISNGDFLIPIPVKQFSNGYILNGSFAQFRAAQELELKECLCLIE